MIKAVAIISVILIGLWFVNVYVSESKVNKIAILVDGKPYTGSIEKLYCRKAKGKKLIFSYIDTQKAPIKIKCGKDGFFKFDRLEGYDIFWGDFSNVMIAQKTPTGGRFSINYMKNMVIIKRLVNFEWFQLTFNEVSYPLKKLKAPNVLALSGKYFYINSKKTDLVTLKKLEKIGIIAINGKLLSVVND